METARNCGLFVLTYLLAVFTDFRVIFGRYGSNLTGKYNCYVNFSYASQRIYSCYDIWGRLSYRLFSQDGS